VKAELSGGVLKVTGPKGTLEQAIHGDVTVGIAGGEISVQRPTDKPEHRALHGLTRALIANMVTGVTEGFTRTLEIQGVGYRASMQGKTLNLALGYSHPVMVEPPPDIEFAVEGTNVIKVSGIDKQRVGQIAANVRAWRKPEPYKGKGIRYQGEYVRRKVGKAGSK
jgi:large subunit ribosomal protein L6